MSSQHPPQVKMDEINPIASSSQSNDMMQLGLNGILEGRIFNRAEP
jgi:hypothetical protein